MIRLVRTRVQIRQLRLQILYLICSLLCRLILLTLHFLHLCLERIILLLKLAVLASERILELLEGFAFLLVLAFPEFLLAGDSLHL